MGLVGQHGASDAVANCRNVGFSCDQSLVDLDEAFRIEPNLRVFQSNILGSGRPPHGDEDAVETLGHGLIASQLNLCLNLAASSGKFFYFGSEVDFVECLFGESDDRSGEVWIDTQQETVLILDQAYLAAQSGVDTS